MTNNAPGLSSYSKNDNSRTITSAGGNPSTQILATSNVTKPGPNKNG